jgi:hypothetical protein
VDCAITVTLVMVNSKLANEVRHTTNPTRRQPATVLASVQGKAHPRRP